MSKNYPGFVGPCDACKQVKHLYKYRKPHERSLYYCVDCHNAACIIERLRSDASRLERKLRSGKACVKEAHLHLH